MTVHDGHRARMRERFLKYGLDNFSEHEVLELLLFYAKARGDVNPLAHRLIRQFGSLRAVLDAPAEELMQVEGVGENTASLLHLMPALFQRYRLSDCGNRMYDTAEKIGNYLVDYYIGHANETLTVLLLDNRSHLLAVKKLAEGTPNTVQMDYRTLMQEALRWRASAVILAHNHPGGSCRPSRQDIAETQCAKQMLQKVDVQLLDHFIIADSQWASVGTFGG